LPIATVILREACQLRWDLSASLWGARTTRFRRPQACRTSDGIFASTAFRTTFVTTRNAPLIGSGMGTLKRIFRKYEINLFFPEGLDKAGLARGVWRKLICPSRLSKNPPG